MVKVLVFVAAGLTARVPWHEPHQQERDTERHADWCNSYNFIQSLAADQRIKPEQHLHNATSAV